MGKLNRHSALVLEYEIHIRQEGGHDRKGIVFVVAVGMFLKGALTYGIKPLMELQSFLQVVLYLLSIRSVVYWF